MYKLGCIALIMLCAPGRSTALSSSWERDALISLYNSTGGPNWTDRSHWLEGNGTECTWHGVICDMPENHVLALLLSNNHLIGTIPVEISALAYLQIVSLANNQLSGSIPSPISSVGLGYVDLSHNFLSGNIPSFAGLSGLSVFDVSFNNLSGSIPNLTGLANLNTFSVNSNQLTGLIPSLAGLSNLQSFDARNNHLSGSIPSLSGLFALTQFYVGGNELHGSPPGPPETNRLANGGSVICPNPLDPINDPAWDMATGVTPWYSACDPIFSNGLE